MCPPVCLQRDIMIISDVLPVMVDDALLSSHPIIVDVSTPAEITSVFDTISYSKVQLEKLAHKRLDSRFLLKTNCNENNPTFTQGASILRMLEDWMGKDMFRDGCRVSQQHHDRYLMVDVALLINDI